MIVHTAWIGPNPIPEDFRANMKTQALFANRFNLWTEKRIAADARVAWVLDTAFWKSCIAAKNYACACDLLRYALLYAMGGMWCDADVELVRGPSLLFSFGPKEDLHCAWEDNQLLGMAVLYAPPRHVIVGRILDGYRARTYADLSEGGGTHGNGPVIFTRAVLERPDPTEFYNVTLHPSETFYPSSWRTPNDVKITPRTVAWHKWAGTWKQTADLSKWIYR